MIRAQNRGVLLSVRVVLPVTERRRVTDTGVQSCGAALQLRGVFGSGPEARRTSASYITAPPAPEEEHSRTVLIVVRARGV